MLHKNFITIAENQNLRVHRLNKNNYLIYGWFENYISSDLPLHDTANLLHAQVLHVLVEGEHHRDHHMDLKGEKEQHLPPLFQWGLPSKSPLNKTASVM